MSVKMCADSRVFVWADSECVGGQSNDVPGHNCVLFANTNGYRDISKSINSVMHNYILDQ